MNAATQRVIVRWLHMITSIPIMGYIYGPIATIPVKWVVVPVVILPGLWLWKGHMIQKAFRHGWHDV